MPRRREAASGQAGPASFCPSCRGAVVAGQNFCGFCGVALHARNVEVPDHLRERVRNARATLEAEHKLVTIMFADVVGSTSLIGDLDPEQAGAVLDPVLQGMVKAVHDQGGVVARIQGDGIMALFGAPLAQEEHAASACRAALAIRALPATPGVATRVGLDSGEVALRVIRNAGFVEYDAMGVHVHIAARMEQTAQPSTIQLTLATSRSLRDQFTLRPLGAVPTKGTPDGTTVAFELIDEAGARERRPAGGYERSPFVNRTAETAALRTAAAATDGLCRVVAFAGHAGTGKSRLVREFVASLDGEAWHVLEASTSGEERGSSYRPFVRIVCDCLGIDPYGAHEPITQQLERTVSGGRASLRGLLAPLLALFGNPVDDKSWTALTASVRRRRMVEAVATLIQHTRGRRKLLLVIEDVHWFDPESDALLDDLIKELSGQSVMVVATYRPNYRERWRRNSNYRRIKVEPLAESDCRRLLDAQLGRDPSLSAIKSQLVARTQGVPLFVEEMVKTLSETSMLRGQAGNYRASASVVQFKIPDSVRPVLAARVDRLPAVPKEILQIAAAIGAEFDLDLLAAVHDCTIAELEPHLEILEAGDFIVARKGKFTGRLAFRHVLIQEVTYRSLLSTKRQPIHAAIANAFETLYPQRLQEEAEFLARHCLEGRVWDRAVTHLKEAAHKAIEYAAHPQAIHAIDQAIEALHSIPNQNREVVETEIELRLRLRESLGALGQYDRWLANLDAAEQLASELDDQARILAIRVGRLHLHNVHADIRGAIKACRDAHAMAAAQNHAQHIVAAAYFESQARNWHGQYRAAIDCLQAAQPTLESLPPDARCGMTGTARVMFHAQLASSHAWLGEFSQAIADGRTAWRLADETKRDFDRAVASFGYGTALVLKGVNDRATAVLEKGIAATERAEIPLLHASLAGPLSYAVLKSGDAARALLLTEQLLALPELSAYARCWAWFYRAQACLETGRADGAGFAEKALERARKNGYQAIEAICHLMLCRFLQQTDAARARQHLETATAMAEALQLVPLAAHCFAESTRLLTTVGQGAQEALAAAADRRYRKLGMRFQVMSIPIGKAAMDGRTAEQGRMAS